MSSGEYQPRTYELSGGSTVRVYNPFEDKCYFAVVDSNGRYPEPGKIARNSGRIEEMHLLDGVVKVTINDIPQMLKVGSGVVVGDGDRYSVEGKGMVVVFVADQEGGTTLIEDLQQLI